LLKKRCRILPAGGTGGVPQLFFLEEGELNVRNRKVQEIPLLPGEFGGVPQI
jgi:hypothetical protein